MFPKCSLDGPSHQSEKLCRNSRKAESQAEPENADVCHFFIAFLLILTFPYCPVSYFAMYVSDLSKKDLFTMSFSFSSVTDWSGIWYLKGYIY